MIDFKHYLITMFNLQIKWGGINRTDNDDFLNKRFELFEQYMLPSVISQTNHNFTWIVLFSASTPAEYKSRICSYEKKMNNFKPIYVEDDKPFSLRQSIVECINDTEERIVVTTRCDNDDILNVDFIKEIQKNVEYNNEDEYILSFPLGYQYDAKTKVLRKYNFPTNHFTTLVSIKKDKTIYDFLHMDIYEQINVKLINGKPLWVEVIHEGNVFNTMGSIRFTDYLKEYDLRSEFSIDLKNKFNIFRLFWLYLYFMIRKIYVKRDRIMIYIKRKLKV